MPLRIGLTGGIGSGKSAVSGLFAALGVPVIDADTIAHDIVSPGKPAYHAVVAAFGHGVVAENGELRREYLREQVFKDPTLKKKLEAILHPAIRAEMDQAISRIKFPYCIISVPLLVETGGKDRFDRILVVDIDEELQIKRTCTRDNTDREQVLRIMASQADRKSRLEIADDIIDNNQGMAALNSQVAALHRRYLQLAHECTHTPS